MAAAMQLNTFVCNMFATGFLDDQFQKMRMHQDKSDPDYVADTVKLFCKEGERIIGELAKLMDKPCVDFDKVSAILHQLNGSSSTVGARRVTNTCVQFSEFSKEKNRDGCLKTLDALRNNFYDLCSMFQIMLQLEKQVKASPKQ